MAPTLPGRDEPSFFAGLSSILSSSTGTEPPKRASRHPLTGPVIQAVRDHPYLVLSVAAASSALTLVGVRVYARYLKRVPNSDWVNPRILAEQRWVRGRVTSVGDADNFRLFHMPLLTWGRWRKIPDTPQELKNQTIHIRIAGVDAPELAHFGRPAQPYGQEALEWLKSMVDGRVVYCQLVRRDQYGRVVATVVVPRWFLPVWLRSGKNVGLEMLRAGLATTYTQSGAEYGKWTVEEFQQVEEEAKYGCFTSTRWIYLTMSYRREKRGMWAKTSKYESPAHYKRRYKTGEGGEELVSKAMEPEPRKGLRSIWPFRWLF
ncbi:SNase-domain-containing protein [Calocera cornea HHB12733]|uniref:SNase-domain-containing protein n=1 Tax=Calocera cornea HHB12733 TaxID=1353952 RepID=A0A165GK73_9BASI|nr:SNase-domain-containing protein [Calocera cornea HHB12733]